MAYVHHVDASIPLGVWDECYFALLSLKTHVQSLPGWQRMEITARDEGERVELHVETVWSDLARLGIWLERGTTPDSLLRSLIPAGDRLDVRLAAQV